MHRPTPILLALFLTAAPLLTGCYKVQARAELKKGNALYANESYREALQEFQKGLELDPTVTFAWRSVGLTALALFKPGDETPENKQFAETAIDAFQKYLSDYPDDEKVRDYLLSTYVNTHRYDDALAAIDKMEAAAQTPEDRAKLEASKINLLIQADRIDDAWKLVQAYNGPTKEELLYTVGQAYWNKSFHSAPEDDQTVRAQWVENGMNALNQALQVKPQYFEAMIYYSLILREKAKLAFADPAQVTALTAQADEWRTKAVALRKQQQEEQKKKEQQEKAAATPATAS
jgi:tetratricopeptide (TPR) repeat protein